MTRSVRLFAGLSALSVLGYLFALANQMLLSFYFGTSRDIDAYLLSLSILQLAIFYIGPVKEALVPELHKRLVDGKTGAYEYFSRAANLVLIVVAGSAVVVAVFAHELASLIVSADQAALENSVAAYLPYLVPLVILLALTEILVALLTAENRLVLQNIGRVIGLAGFGLCVMTLASRMDGHAMIAAAIVGQLVVVAILVAGLRKQGFRYRLSARPGVSRNFRRVMGGLTVTYAFSLVYLVVEKNSLTYFGEGMVSAYQYGAIISQVPQMVLIASMASVIWPKALEAVNRNRIGDIAAMLGRSSRALALLLAGVAVFCWVFAEQIVHVLFFRGAFGEESLASTTTCFRAVLLALVPLGYSTLAGRVFISAGRIKALMAIGALSTLTGLLVIGIGRGTGRLDIMLFHVVAAALVSAIGCACVLRQLLRNASMPASGHGPGLWWTARLASVAVAVGLLMSLAPRDWDDKFTAILALGGYFAVTMIIFAGGSGMAGLIDGETRKVIGSYLRPNQT